MAKMSKLDKLLKVIEKNQAEDISKFETHDFEVPELGETFQVRPMSRLEKKQFFNNTSTNKDMTIGDMIKPNLKVIYNCFGLKEIALAAKEAGHIKSYYDVIDALFEFDTIIRMFNFLLEISNINQNDIDGAEDDIKKP